MTALAGQEQGWETGEKDWQIEEKCFSTVGVWLRAGSHSPGKRTNHPAEKLE